MSIHIIKPLIISWPFCLEMNSGHKMRLG